MKRISGVYMILNRINGKKYIGSSKDVYNRWNQHLTELRKGKHTKHIQAAYYKYGEESFVFMVIEIIKYLDQLTTREQYWKDFYKSYDRIYGYDICRYASSTLGYKHTEKTKKKISLAHNGKINSEETRGKISLANKGENHPLFGKHHTEETRKRMSLIHIGKHLSKENKEKISLALKGKPLSEETKKKMSLSGKGKPKSEETKIKMRIAAKKRANH